ncbi:hypothetical protein AAF712_011077 [Marasmius tenuissimus]|uniref:CAP-Gly domain-containing protein n=1 Tax=Marasmius tenuissimus TaxID=585030 RepID=A0ABR2ZLN6_9AGAR
MASVKPRQTGIPTPGRPSGGSSGIPTPGTRSRSSSQAGSYLPSSSSTALDEEYMNLAFKNAVKANDPFQHRGLASSSSFSQSQGSGLNQSMARAKTPTSMRPPSRQSDVGLAGVRSVSRAGWVPEVGDAVRIESLGFEGILQFVGDIEGKQGLWAGVELSGGFAGKGKNDGSVAGKQYFKCPPKCGVFVATTKLSPPTVSHPGARPSSVASSRGGRTTPSFSTSTSGRITPSSFSLSRGPSTRMSFGSGRTTPSTNGRITPSTSTNMTSPETPAVRAARLKAMAKAGNNSTSTSKASLAKSTNAGATPMAKSKSTNGQTAVPVPGVPTPGSRASKYTGVTAKQLSLNKSTSSPVTSMKSPTGTSIPSPKTTLSPVTNIPTTGVSPSRIRTISGVNSTSGIGSPFGTPKPRIGTGFAAPSSGISSPVAGNTPKARIPSGVAMPPPPIPLPRLGSGSPMRSVSATSSSSTASVDMGSPCASPTRRGRVTDLSILSSDELEARGKVLQDRIAGLTGGKVTPSPSPVPSTSSSGGSPPGPGQAPGSPVRRGTIVGSRARSRSRARTTTTASPRRPSSRTAYSRPSSVASNRPGSVAAAAALGKSGRMSVDPGAQVDQMQSRIQALEYENTRLRSKVDELEGEVLVGKSAAASASSSSLEEMEEEKKKVLELNEKVEMLEGDKTKLAGDMKRLEERKAELETAYDRLEAEKVQFQETQSKLEASKKEAEELNETLQSQKSHLQGTVNRLEEEKDRVEEEKKTVETSKGEVEAKLKKVIVDFEEERRDLREMIDELRHAGQETIALYEEKLRQADLQKYDLEDRIAELEAQASSNLSRSTNAKLNGIKDKDMNGHRRSPSAASSNTAVSTKPTSDDADSPLPLHRLRRRRCNSSFRICSTRSLRWRICWTIRGRIMRLRLRRLLRELRRRRRGRKGFRKEVADLKRELGEAKREKERVVREGERRVMEVEEALRESTVTLEEMRAEVEGLRGELANVNGLAASTSSATGELQSKLTEAQIRAEQEKEGFLDEIQRLTEKMADWEARCEKLKQLTEEQTTEIEGLKKKTNRDVSINGSVLQSPSTPSKQEKYDKHELNTAKEEITGLKHIVQELQKESVAGSQRNKVLESENQLLMSEMEKLRQEVKILEDNLDQSILREEENLHIDGSGTDPSDVEALKKTLKEQRLRTDVEIEQLRKKLADAEMKNARTTHDLNKEISELESLVEAKIYREDELDQEVERLKEKVAKLERKVSKTSTGPETVVAQAEEHVRSASLTSTAPSHISTPSISSVTSIDVCEICEKPGHDIFTCDLLKEDGPLSATSITSAAHKAINGDREEEEELDVWCEDCEGHGHTAENCPNSEDVF